jgi:hypothetical protein
MLQRIDAPDTILAFRAIGKIERSDYDDVLEPAVEAMIADRGEIRLVYVLGEEFEEYTAAASWEDVKLGIGHASKWKRIAVVTDNHHLRQGVRMLGWMVPGEVKTFGASEEAAAIEWAVG